MKKRIAWSVLVVLLAAGPAAAADSATADSAAKDKDVATRSMIIDEIVALGRAATPIPTIRDPFSRYVSIAAPEELVSYLITIYSARAQYRALLDAMEARIDKQVGSTPGNSGSTSLAMKGLVPKILGVAVENGALNEDQKGTTVTFRTTPAGIVKALQGSGLVDTTTDYANNAGSWLASRFSAAASFDTSRGSDTNTLTASGQQLSSWSARLVVVNQRDPASMGYRKQWMDIAHNSSAYLNAAQALSDVLKKPGTPFDKWDQELLAKVQQDVEGPLQTNHDVNAAAVKFKKILQEQLPALEKIALPDDALKALDAYVKQLSSVEQQIDDVYAFAGKGALMTLDWSTTRDPQLPDLYTATLVWEDGVGASRQSNVTLNAALSFFRSTPTNAVEQFKSFDASVQLDHPLGRISTSMPSVTLSIAGKYSYLPNDTVASTTTAAAGSAPALKGSIGVVQVKLTIPVKGSGLKVPLSVTASNRTELIKEKDVRASFGISYDLDPLVGGLFGK